MHINTAFVSLVLLLRPRPTLDNPRREHDARTHAVFTEAMSPRNSV